VARFASQALVVSLGVDVFEVGPFSFFAVKPTEFPRIGERVAGIGRLTLFVMEGGDAVEALGQTMVNVCTGYLNA